MIERPILFSKPMVRALLDGRKTQTRRSVKVAQPDRWEACHPAGGLPGWFDFWKVGDPATERVRCPYGVPGDRLWVRETFQATENAEGIDCLTYLADGAENPIENSSEAADRWLKVYTYAGKRGPKVPAIHMPRWASRLTLEITDVRIERLQDISEADAETEGCVAGMVANSGFGPVPMGAGWTIESPGFYASAAGRYQMLWNDINGPDAWDENPWVWALSFSVKAP